MVFKGENYDISDGYDRYDRYDRDAMDKNGINYNMHHTSLYPSAFASFSIVSKFSAFIAFI
jgi:hypothetical protein